MPKSLDALRLASRITAHYSVWTEYERLVIWRALHGLDEYGQHRQESLGELLSQTCEHEFGALGAVSGDYCIHCGERMSTDVKAGSP